MISFFRLMKWMAVVDALFTKANISSEDDRIKTRFSPELESATGPPFLRRLFVQKEFRGGRGSIVWQAEAEVSGPCAAFTFTAAYGDDEVQTVEFALVANGPATAERFELRVKCPNDAAFQVVDNHYEDYGFGLIEEILERFLVRNRELPQLQAM